jgi:nucleosome binding factor SPN SPT16 subunit
LGIEFRESRYVLTSKLTEEVVPGMVFNICTGFSNLVHPAYVLQAIVNVGVDGSGC